ncbi:MAG: maleylacetoacetate isomerase [Pseudomonadota bacterium]
MSGIVLHSFFRSSTSFRVRAALRLKGIDFKQNTYDFRKNEQRSAEYLTRNPQGLVPTLTTDDGVDIPQSLAIIEWLEETYPEPALLPEDRAGRARVRSLAHAIALDVHPVNNLRILNYLKERFGGSEKAIADWFRHWVGLGFQSVEQRLKIDKDTGTFCHGETVTLADICLTAQYVNNSRFAVDHKPFPNIQRIAAVCLEMPEFKAAMPAAQPDAV